MVSQPISKRVPHKARGSSYFYCWRLDTCGLFLFVVSSSVTSRNVICRRREKGMNDITAVQLTIHHSVYGEGCSTQIDLMDVFIWQISTLNGCHYSVKNYNKIKSSQVKDLCSTEAFPSLFFGLFTESLVGLRFIRIDQRIFNTIIIQFDLLFTYSNNVNSFVILIIFL